jgi:hypothetical protein
VHTECLKKEKGEMIAKRMIIAVCCLFVVMVFFSLTTRSQKPDQAQRFETVLIGTGGAPRWSPDGTKLAFMSGGWLCVANVDGKGEIQKVVQLRPWIFDWMSDSAFVISEKTPWNAQGKGRGHKFIIETLDIKGKSQIVREDSIPGIPESKYISYIGAPVVLADGTVGYYEIHESPEGETKIFKTVKQGKFKPEEVARQVYVSVVPYPWGDLYLQRVDGGENKKLTSGERKYTLPQLSPDGLMIMSYYGGYNGGGIDILDTNGNVIGNIPAREVTPGLYGKPTYETWSSNGKQIAYCLWVERGDSTYGSEIWLANSDGTNEVPITNTPDEIETSPVFSLDNSRIAFVTESGKIIVVKLK